MGIPLLLEPSSLLLGLLQLRLSRAQLKLDPIQVSLKLGDFGLIIGVRSFNASLCHGQVGLFLRPGLPSLLAGLDGQVGLV